MEQLVLWNVVDFGLWKFSLGCMFINKKMYTLAVKNIINLPSPKKWRNNSLAKYSSTDTARKTWNRQSGWRGVGYFFIYLLNLPKYVKISIWREFYAANFGKQYLLIWNFSNQKFLPAIFLQPSNVSKVKLI